jgi:PEP-CTERM motif
MKHIAEAGGRKSFTSWASRFASASAMAVVLLLMSPAAKANVVETFNLSGSLDTVFGSPVPFSGRINVDFTNDFADDTVTSIQISVQGRPVFRQSPSLNLATSAIGVIGASNASGDVLSLTFTTANPGTWNGFNAGSIVNGQVIFGGLTGMFLGANGVIIRDASSPVISGPPDPPSVPVPELSTWAMMLLGLAGLGLAAKGRRALAFLSGRA